MLAPRETQEIQDLLWLDTKLKCRELVIFHKKMINDEDQIKITLINKRKFEHVSLINNNVLFSILSTQKLNKARNQIIS
jgi:hypothetical protein